MRTLKLLLVLLLALPSGAFAQDKLNVVTTTEDLGSLAREVGGDKVSVTALGSEGPAGDVGGPAIRRLVETASSQELMSALDAAGWLGNQ